MNGKKTIGILGGMGPLATADLFEKITLLTKAETDRDHIRVYIDSNTNIPDRTAAILNGGADPVPEMADALKHLEQCGADCVIMPCNTVSQYPHRRGGSLRPAVPRKDRRNSGDPGYAGGWPLSAGAGGAGRRIPCPGRSGAGRIDARYL